MAFFGVGLPVWVALVALLASAMIGGIVLGHPGIVPFLPSSLARASMVGTVRKSTPVGGHGSAEDILSIVSDVDEGFDSVEKTVALYYYPETGTGRVAPGGGLTSIPQDVWSGLLDLARCKILSRIDGGLDGGSEMGKGKGERADGGSGIVAYLLSESSLFVTPRRVTLKTCGTTTLLHALPRLLSIVQGHLGPGYAVVRYTRGEFLFPSTQAAPHTSWADEVGFLQGKLAGTVGSSRRLLGGEPRDAHSHFVSRLLPIGPGGEANPSRATVFPVPGGENDARLEVVLRGIPPERMEPFCAKGALAEGRGGPAPDQLAALRRAHGRGGQHPSRLRAIRDRFDAVFAGTRVDAYDFEPCGYSANGIVVGKNGTGDANGNDDGDANGWWTVHLSPDAYGAEYVSLETDAVGADARGCAWATGLADLFAARRVSVRMITMNLAGPGSSKAARAIECTVDGMETQGYTIVGDDESTVGPHAEARLVTLVRREGFVPTPVEGFDLPEE